MQAKIKTAAAFRTAYDRKVLDYDTILESLESLPSTVTLLGGDIPRELAGGWLWMADSLFLIAEVSPGEGMTTLQLQSPLDAFSRPRIYEPPAEGTTLGEFVIGELADGWRDLTDTVYALPYLELEAEDSIDFVPPTVDDQGFYVLSSYLRTARRDHGLELRFVPDGDELRITARNAVTGSHTLIAGDGHTELASNTFSRTAVAKVTTVQPVDTGEVDEEGQKIFRTDVTDWYLGLDGSVSSQEPAGRASGSWSVVTVAAKNDAEEAARAVFGKNSETHKVEFWTDFRPGLLDDFRLRLPSGAAFEGQVQAVRKLRGNRRWLCQAGTWPVTLTDKVRKSSGGSSGGGGRSGGSSAQIYAIGDIFITTRAGDPAQLLGYGAWTRIEGCYLYCADQSIPAGTHGGESSHALTAAELPSTVQVVDPTELYITGTGSGSAHNGVASWQGGQSPATAPLGSGTPIPLKPRCFSIFVWLRKA